MNETDRDLVFSESVKAGKRIYYFDVKQSRSGDRFVAITESKKINEGTVENPRFVFEKHKIFLYKEDFQKFANALAKTLGVATTGIIPEFEAVPTREAEAPSVAVEAAKSEAPSVAEHEAPVEAEVQAVPADTEQTQAAPAVEVAPVASNNESKPEVEKDQENKPKKGWFSW